MRDGATTVEAAVRSIVWQTYSDWELILIDDGSRDDGPTRVARVNEPRIRLIRHASSRGLPARLNEAINLARGEYIARMDADDICYPERLAEQVSQLRSNPDIDVVASQALAFRRRGEIIGVMRAPVRHEEIVARPYRGFSFAHPTWCGKASWFRKHLYDPTALTAQDWDLLIRSASFSRFAAADKILLGYRKERVRLAKSFDGRVIFSKAIWRDAKCSGRYAQAATEIALHFARFGLEAAAITLGAEEWWLRQKLRSSLTPEQINRWQAVWSAATTV